MQLYAIYKRLKKMQNTNKLKVKEWKKYFMQIGTKESRDDDTYIRQNEL